MTTYKTPTFFQYFKNNLIRKDGAVIDHDLRCDLVELHGREYVRFYIHPHGRDGDTPIYMVAQDTGVGDGTIENQLLPATLDMEFPPTYDGKARHDFKAIDPLCEAKSVVLEYYPFYHSIQNMILKNGAFFTYAKDTECANLLCEELNKNEQKN